MAVAATGQHQVVPREGVGLGAWTHARCAFLPFNPEPRIRRWRPAAAHP